MLLVRVSSVVMPVSVVIVRLWRTVTLLMVVAMLSVRVRLVPAVLMGVLVLMSVVVAVLCHGVMP